MGCDRSDVERLHLTMPINGRRITWRFRMSPKTLVRHAAVSFQSFEMVIQVNNLAVVYQEEASWRIWKEFPLKGCLLSGLFL